MGPSIGLLMLYLAGSILLRVLIDAPGDAGWRWTWRYLSLPVAALVVYGTWGRRRVRVGDAAGASRRPWLGALVTYGLLMLGAPAWVLMANALGGSPEPVTVAGPVVEKWSRSYKTTTYSLQILDDGSGAPLSIRVSPTEYGAAAVGTRFSRTFLRGRLGLLYRWTFG